MHGNIWAGIDHRGSFRTGTSHHGNAWEFLGGNWPPLVLPYGNQPPRKCTGIFGWELAITGMHGNVGWEHPYTDVQCVFGRSSACHTKNTTPPSKLVVQLFNCLRDCSRNLAAVKDQKTKADEVVLELRLEKPITWSLPDYLKTAGTTLICETKNTRLPATTPPRLHIELKHTIQCRPYAILSAPTAVQRFNNKTKLKSLDNIVATLFYLYAYRNWFCVPARYWELNTCAVLGLIGNQKPREFGIFHGIWLGRNSEILCPWVRYGWEREEAICLGTVRMGTGIAIYGGTGPISRSCGNTAGKMLSREGP